MVFPSVPIYLDPANWPQQSGGGSCDLSNNHRQMPPLDCGVGGETGGGTSSIKSSVLPMTDRARTAKIPYPEAALKCPRCESTNTKFCYFNNYSLTQPRHLCKTCRRYWTRGGSLRNVPVGGGCRRNKRTGGSKGSSRSKSPAATTGADNNNNSALPPAPATSSDVMMTHFPPPQPNFMTHLSQSNNQYGGLSFGGIQVRGSGNSDDNINDDVEFQMNIGGGFPEQWRVQQQQFPFMMNNYMEAAPATGNIYTYESEGGSGAGIESYNNNNSSQIGSKALDASSVKVEGNNNNNILNLSRNFLGISNGGDQNQYWVGGGGGGNAWTELARFTNSSSSTRHLL